MPILRNNQPRASAQMAKQWGMLSPDWGRTNALSGADVRLCLVTIICYCFDEGDARLERPAAVVWAANSHMQRRLVPLQENRLP
jgi:hypothetical protein